MSCPLGGASQKVVVGQKTAEALEATGGPPSVAEAQKAVDEVALQRKVAEGLLASAQLARLRAERTSGNERKAQEEEAARAEAVAKEIEDSLPGKTMNYHDYLKLDTILHCQELESAKKRPEGPAHDEMLFIIIHQSYELWFKQIAHELTAVVSMLQQDYVPEQQIGRVVHHLRRVIEILKLCIQQFDVLETMTPLDFMEFRDYLVPASGFQSFQFRMFENVLGVDPKKRVLHHGQPYWRNLSPLHQAMAFEAEQGPTLFSALESWLERTPFVDGESSKFNFLESYRKSVEAMFDADVEAVKESHSDEDIRADEITRVELNRSEFAALFDEEAHEDLRSKGRRRLSLRGIQAALLINVYHEEGLMQMPHLLLQCAIDIDELVVGFRMKHAMMVTRMIGTKLGTGASSGYGYLKSTIERNRVFSDITNLATFVIPRSHVPALPDDVRDLFRSHLEVAKK